MRPDLDYSTFDRLLVSAGAVCVLAAIALPAVLFQEGSSTLVSENEIRDLTADAQKILAIRQSSLLFLHEHYWVASLSVALAGVSFLLWGGRSMRIRQQRSDRMQENEELQQQHALRQQSRAERSERLDEAADAAGFAAYAADGGRDVFKRDFQMVSEQVVAKLARSTAATHSAKYEVAVGEDEERLRLDGLLRARTRDGWDVVLEIKLFDRWDEHRYESALQETALLTHRYKHRTHRNAVGLVTCVIRHVADHQERAFASIGHHEGETVASRVLTNEELEAWEPDLAELFRELPDIAQVFASPASMQG